MMKSKLILLVILSIVLFLPAAHSRSLDFQIMASPEWSFTSIGPKETFLGSPSETGLVGYLAPKSVPAKKYSPSLLVYEIKMPNVKWNLTHFDRWIENIGSGKFLTKMSSGKFRSLADRGQTIYHATFQSFEGKSSHAKPQTYAFYVFNTRNKLVVLSYHNYTKQYPGYKNQIIDLVRKTKITHKSLVGAL